METSKFVNNGETVVVKAKKDIKQGDIVKLGDKLAGIAGTSGAKDKHVTVALEGAFQVPKSNASMKAGDAVYFKEAEGVVTVTESDGPKLGVALKEAKTSDTTVLVKLK